MIDPNILTGLMYVGSVFLFGTRGYLGVTGETTDQIESDFQGLHHEVEAERMDNKIVD